MVTPVQIVFDCADPDRLAAFWASALHYRVQGPPEGYGSWEAFLTAMRVPKEAWNDASAIVDPEKVAPRIYFQRMGTPKLGKNRVHLDLNISDGARVPLEERIARVDSEVERLLGLGATRQRAWTESGEYWVVLQDPDGNEFCVQ